MHSVLEKLKKNKIDKIKLGIFDVDGVMRGKYINMKNFPQLSKKDSDSVMWYSAGIL